MDRHWHVQPVAHGNGPTLRRSIDLYFGQGPLPAGSVRRAGSVVILQVPVGLSHQRLVPGLDSQVQVRSRFRRNIKVVVVALAVTAVEVRPVAVAQSAPERQGEADRDGAGQGGEPDERDDIVRCPERPQRGGERELKYG